MVDCPLAGWHAFLHPSSNTELLDVLESLRVSELGWRHKLRRSERRHAIQIRGVKVFRPEMLTVSLPTLLHVKLADSLGCCCAQLDFLHFIQRMLLLLLLLLQLLLHAITRLQGL